MIGQSQLDQRNYQPVLVDAATSKLTGVPTWPVTLSAMYLSKPVHFGLFGGLPLKIGCALVVIIAVIKLGSGIYLWVGHRGQSLQRRVHEVVEGGEAK